MATDHRDLTGCSLFHEQPPFGRPRLPDCGQQRFLIILIIGMGNPALNLTGLAAQAAIRSDINNFHDRLLMTGPGQPGVH
ncbi:MAG: hypothetical protein WGN25_10180 [Candidatus Electrothrix sp. GW3-4]|uniref:hypothetical protein n=1 Tax=Candidatus Electrothrix sp. GW3-4 TaxID=3126740 RepID=UPI0030D47F4A